MHNLIGSEVTNKHGALFSVLAVVVDGGEIIVRLLPSCELDEANDVGIPLALFAAEFSPRVIRPHGAA